MVVETTKNDVYFRESTDGVTAVRARPHEPVRPVCGPRHTIRCIREAWTAPPPQGVGLRPTPRTYPLGGRASRPARARDSARKRPADSEVQTRRHCAPRFAASTRSRVAVYRVQAAASGPLDAFSPRHSSHPTMTIMLTPAAKASTSATVCLSDVLFCSRAGSTSTVAT